MGYLQSILLVLLPCSLLCGPMAPYICNSYDTCSITCSEGGEAGALPCNDFGEFNAINGPYFNILCPTTDSCKNLLIKCPTKYYNSTADGRCNITCTANNSCQGIEINGNLNLHTELNCYGDDNNSNICQNVTMSIDNTNYIKKTKTKKNIDEQALSSINITCQSYNLFNTDHDAQLICSSIHIDQSATKSTQNSSTLTLTCMYDVNCNDISINTPDIQRINILIAEFSLLTKSNIINNNNVNLYLSQSIVSNANVTISHEKSETIVNNTNVINIVLNDNSIINRSSFYIDNAENVYLSSDDAESQLINSYFQISNTKPTVHTFEIINVNTVENNTMNADFVEVFKLTCNHKYCGQFVPQINIAHTINATFDMQTGSTLTANINANNAQNLNISIDEFSNLQNSIITAQNVGAIIITINGTTQDQNTIHAAKANLFRLYCLNDFSCRNDLQLYIPPKSKNQYHSYIDCIASACYELTLYTKNAVSADVKFNRTDCPCSHDISDGCFAQWDLHCGADYNQHSILKNATTCVAATRPRLTMTHNANVCCGDVVQDIHDKYRCPWPSNDSYICIENTHCLVNCSYVVQQTNASHFLCSNNNASIDATKALSLRLICGDGAASCHSLEIYCPLHSGECVVNCNENEACAFAEIYTQKTNAFYLNCVADGSCEGTVVNNNALDDNSVINILAIVCNEGGCKDMDFIDIGSAQFELQCNKGNKNKLACDGIHVDAISSDDFLVTANGMVNDSFFNVSHGNNVRFFINDVMLNSVIDVNYSDSVCVNMSNKNEYGLIQNTVIYGANIVNTMELTCYAETQDMGCINVSLYARQTTPDKNTKAVINCIGNNGCNQLSLYSINAVTQDIDFEIRNCSCDVMRGMGCSNLINLYCGSREYNKYSNFSGNPFECTGECCGNITAAFQTTKCELYCSPNYFCPINCVNDICNGLHINASQSTALSLSCVTNDDKKVNCDNMVIECPKYEFCDVQCLGNGVCKTLTVNTNSVNNTNLSCATYESITTACYGARIRIANDKNDNSYHKNVTFGCMNGICQQVLISNHTELTDDKNININLVLNGGGTIKTLHSQSNIYYDYVIKGDGFLNSTIFNVTNSILIEGVSVFDTTFDSPLKRLNVNIQSQLFKNNKIHCSPAENSFLFSGNALFQSNNIFIPNGINGSLRIHCISNCKFLSNNIYYSNAKNENDITLELDCNNVGFIRDTHIYANYLNYKIDVGGNCQLLNNNISAAQSNTFSIHSENGAIIGNMIINAYNSSSMIVAFNGPVNDSYINASNSKHISVYCGDTAFEQDTKCHNLSIVFPAKNKTTNKTFSTLKCYKYGCEMLTLYTINGADDINISGIHCECKEDITTACIRQWNIYCNDYARGPSIFRSARNCTGECCQNVVQQLHIKECKWDPDDNGLSSNDITYVIAASTVIICCVTSLIGVICWRKKRIERENNEYLEKHKIIE